LMPVYNSRLKFPFACRTSSERTGKKEKK